MQPKLADQQLAVLTALPASNTTATSNGIDLATTPNGDLLAEFELSISVPAVPTGALADAATHKFDIVTGATVSAGVIQSPTTIYSTVLTQTGAGGVGSAAVSARVRLPVGCQRYVGVKVTKSDNHDASAVSYTTQLLF